MFAPELCLTGLSVPTADAAIRALAGALLAGGHVRESFAQAAALREKRSPTGLPFAGLAVALPHAEPEHVVSPATAVASLASPVKFRQMGSPQIQLDVRLVVMPAFTAKEQAAAGLSRFIELLQDEALRAELAAAPTPAALYSALVQRAKA
jgi:PTS system galactitol-specific IIA component